ncbi:hypothetical protein A2U01_0102608, partial [Trifolium medium]|nr:hypothetical protein [Trifolium medium]
AQAERQHREMMQVLQQQRAEQCFTAEVLQQQQRFYSNIGRCRFEFKNCRFTTRSNL